MRPEITIIDVGNNFLGAKTKVKCECNKGKIFNRVGFYIDSTIPRWSARKKTGQIWKCANGCGKEFALKKEVFTETL